MVPGKSRRREGLELLLQQKRGQNFRGYFETRVETVPKKPILSKQIFARLLVVQTRRNTKKIHLFNSFGLTVLRGGQQNFSLERVKLVPFGGLPSLKLT